MVAQDHHEDVGMPGALEERVLCCGARTGKRVLGFHTIVFSAARVRTCKSGCLDEHERLKDWGARGNLALAKRGCYARPCFACAQLRHLATHVLVRETRGITLLESQGSGHAESQQIANPTPFHRRGCGWECDTTLRG